MSTKNDTEPATAIAVFGIPRGGKTPVGARFSANDIGVARWIAKHQGLQLLLAKSAPAIELTALLREWQIRANGAAILPVLSLSMAENLRALAADTANAPGPAAGDDGPTAADRTAARLALASPLWAAMAVDDIVLTMEYDRRGVSEGWWEAVILSIANDVYTVCWLEDPETGFRKRKPHELAPLHPTAAQVWR